jgi:hypothetical protein
VKIKKKPFSPLLSKRLRDVNQEFPNSIELHAMYQTNCSLCVCSIFIDDNYNVAVIVMMIIIMETQGIIVP